MHTPPSSRRRPARRRRRARRLTARSSVVLALLATGVLATTGTAAALLSGAVSSPACAASLVISPVPIVATSMYPNQGLPSGGTPVTISGAGFGSSEGNPSIWAVFDFGFNAAVADPPGEDILVSVETVIVNSTTLFIPSTPPEQNGTASVNVYLATPNSFVDIPEGRPPGPGWVKHNLTLVGPFTYTLNPAPTTTTTIPPTTTTTTSSTTTSTTTTVPPLPIVDAVDPPVGNPTGGTPVTIVGTNLAGATAVKFGTANAASFTVINGGTIAAVAPPGSGVVDVIIVTPGGSSAPTMVDKFTYTGALPEFRRGCTPH